MQHQTYTHIPWIRLIEVGTGSGLRLCELLLELHVALTPPRTQGQQARKCYLRRKVADEFNKKS
jgi:hypothetical protein